MSRDEHGSRGVGNPALLASRGGRSLAPMRKPFALRTSKDLLDRARAKAKAEGRTLTSVVEEAVRLMVDSDKPGQTPPETSERPT